MRQLHNAPAAKPCFASIHLRTTMQKKCKEMIVVNGDGAPRRTLRAIELMYQGKPTMFRIEMNRFARLLYRSRVEYLQDADNWSKGLVRYYAKLLTVLDWHWNNYQRLTKGKIRYTIVNRHGSQT